MVLFLLKLKRVYDPPTREDGFRLLVDRLWPRGMSKERAKLDLWLKEVAPSEELRRWFSQEPHRWAEFKKKYQEELDSKRALLIQIKQLEAEKGIVTLVYSSRDLKHNNAVVLKAVLDKLKLA